MLGVLLDLTQLCEFLPVISEDFFARLVTKVCIVSQLSVRFLHLSALVVKPRVFQDARVGVRLKFCKILIGDFGDRR